MSIKIEINNSSTMDSVKEDYPYLEDRVIRIPLENRKILGVEIGSFVSLKGKTKTITLQVANAFYEDVIDDPMTAYVSSKIFGEINTKTSTNTVFIEPVGGITLGCDPEIFLIDKVTRKIVKAENFFRKWTPVGYDGDMMEIRPAPSTEEVVLLDNIYNLLLSARHVLDNYESGKNSMMIGVSHYETFTAGFHLHFGLPQAILGRRLGVRSLAMQVVNALDYYVGIPSIIPEGKQDSFRRTTQWLDYGKPGNYRIDNRTLEYRVPGGYLMRHPILTLGLISIGALVVEDLVSRIKMCTDNFMNIGKIATHEDIVEIYPNILDIKDLWATVCSTSVEKAQGFLETIESDFEKMIGYKKKEPYIRQFMHCLKNDITFTEDIEYNWRNFYNEEQSRQMVIHTPFNETTSR